MRIRAYIKLTINSRNVYTLECGLSRCQVSSKAPPNLATSADVDAHLSSGVKITPSTVFITTALYCIRPPTGHAESCSNAYSMRHWGAVITRVSLFSGRYGANMGLAEPPWAWGEAFGPRIERSTSFLPTIYCRCRQSEWLAWGAFLCQEAFSVCLSFVSEAFCRSLKPNPTRYRYLVSDLDSWCLGYFFTAVIYLQYLLIL